MATVAVRSPSEKVGGLFYFGRMLDKIRLHAKSELPPDYHANLGKGFDEKCTTFLRIDYDQLAERVKRGGTDEEVLQWCFESGRRLERRKKEAGMTDRSDIQTAFQFIDADEGRLPSLG